MEKTLSPFEVLNAINCNEHTEKKNGLTYLSWAWAWQIVKKNYPTASYTVYENADGWNYFTDGTRRSSAALRRPPPVTASASTSTRAKTCPKTPRRRSRRPRTRPNAPSGPRHRPHPRARPRSPQTRRRPAP